MKQINQHPSNAVPNVVRSRTCVLFPGALGDFICFLPALQTLARDADVDLFARSEFADIVTSRVTVRSLEVYEISRLFVANTAEDRRLQKFFGAYTAIYSWLGNQQREFVQRLQSLCYGRAEIFPFRPNNSETHQTDYYLSCLRGDSVDSRQPVVGLRPEGMGWCAHFWVRHELHRRPVMVIAPGSGAREKNWPEEFFLAVVEWWRQAVDGVAVLVAGPVEEERGGTERLRPSCIVASDLTLSQAAALLAGCELYLGNDSGITHLAAATGIRTVALFGPSNARQWAPRGNRVTVINRNIECSPCQITKMKSCPHRACLTELRPTDVIGVVATLPEVVTLTRMGAGIKV
jgi:ADP-heptose:LPS heptosyltransferase